MHIGARGKYSLGGEQRLLLGSATGVIDKGSGIGSSLYLYPAAPQRDVTLFTWILRIEGGP